IAIFEIGSLFCAVAPSVNFLIFGRAFAGVGASGLGISCMYIVAKVFSPIGTQPILDVHSVAFTAVALLLPQITIKNCDQSTWEAWQRLDWIGVFLSIAIITLFLLPVQWGGNERLWSDPVIIVLLILSGITLAIFIAWEHRKGLEALLPLDMFMHHNMLGVCLHSVSSGVATDLYYHSIFLFQLFLYQLRGHSATKSGIDIIPFMMYKLGYVWPFLFFGPLAGAVASGLMFSLNMNSSFARIAGYQILMGARLGVALQTSLVVAQAEFSKDETRLSQATSMATFMKVLGYTMGLVCASLTFTFVPS
ncbi:hypothetical protein ARMSODRAFT_1034428, partial [Armillaria solidipes]